VSGPFHIRRIRLLNFHNLVDETLPVRKNLFLIGDNQSGKTTVLDAVHFALSAGVEMEFNSAARFGPRTEPGRSLASVVLRYDLERDVPQRGPAVMYAALEIADPAGATHCFGAGAFATSLDSQPEVWGFVARGRTLEEVGLCAEEPDSTGALRRRPRDRQELEERLGRGAVLDKGRYRTAVAQLLFRDRDAYLRAMELIAAGKAYREMVARARNLDELFVGLLPPPAETEFEEVRSALRAIEGIRSDLGDLEAELAVLRGVLEKLQGARDETEKIARYGFVGAELARRAAAGDLDHARRQAQAAAAAAARAEADKQAAAAAVARWDESLRSLQASEGAALLAREEEARRDAAEAEREAGRAGEDLAARREAHRHAMQEATGAEAELDAARERALAALRPASAAVRLHLGDEAEVALGALAGAISTLEPAAPAAAGDLERPLAVLRSGFEEARDAASVRAAVAGDEAERQRAAAAAAAEQAGEVRRQREVPPDLPGYAALLASLETAAPQAVPLYRLCELAPQTAETLGAGIECVLGGRLLGAIVAPPGQHATARARVLAHGAGVEVVDPSDFPGLPAGGDAGGDAAPAGTLLAALAPAGPPALASLARAFLRRAAGDLHLLAGGEARGEAERAVWTDGRIYEHGAESRVDAAAPRLLGAEARARAAAQEEARLRELAARHLADGDRAAAAAAAQREVAESCRQALAQLGDCAPAPLIARLETATNARTRLPEREAAVLQAGERVESAERRLAQLRARHAEIAAAIAGAGISDLRERIVRTEAALERARAEEKAAIDRAAGAREEAQQRAGQQAAAESRLQAEAAAAEARREALLPLVEPRHRGDLEDYAFRIMRGQQILAGNVPGLITEASNARARAFQWLVSSDGLHNERVWQKYGFKLFEQRQEIRDQADRPVEQVYAERQTEVRALQEALDQRSRDLLERVVMAGLVRRLQGQVRELREIIQGINRLAADLRFGSSRFQFSLRQRPELQRLLELLREQSVLQPALREELRDFFQARLDDLRQAREGEVPEILDYRRWFEYVLQVQSRGDGAALDLSRQRLRFGSTGEQAVPTYLLVIAVASLLFDRTDARLRLLLLDEAFLGIDAGRREVLMQFADRVGVDLIVATPELDGVTPALAASSTLFIEKTPEQDVFISDFHWQRPGAQPTLFERREEPAEADLLLGVAGPEAGGAAGPEAGGPAGPESGGAADPEVGAGPGPEAGAGPGSEADSAAPPDVMALSAARPSADPAPAGDDAAGVADARPSGGTAPTGWTPP
jgi:recombinational DNA repair ATPase RecF